MELARTLINWHVIIDEIWLALYQRVCLQQYELVEVHMTGTMTHSARDND
jgi:hypothetical protein